MQVTEREHVVALCGSQRDGSYTRRALERVLAAAEERGATTDLVDLAAMDLPVFDPDGSDAGDADSLRRRVRAADAVVLGTPMYHGSYASPLKTAIDYCGFDEFEGKTVGLLAVAGGSFPVTALDHLRSVCRALNCWVVPHQAAVPRAYRNVSYEDGTGRITDADIEERLRVLGRRVVQYANIEPDPETFEASENVGAGD